MKKKDFYFKEPIKEILTDWDEADGCFATDKIMVEGSQIGYMYREEPDDTEYGGYDSGWRFMAGDETEEYMDDPNNSGVYKLNTICNYSPDILPFLHAPYGTAFFRDENGHFVEEELDIPM